MAIWLDKMGRTCIRVEQGVKVSFKKIRPTERGRANGWWRFGVSVAMYDWLTNNIGKTVNHEQWENGEGDWLFLGSFDMVASERRPANISIQFMFRTKQQAMLYKLVWHDEF